MKARYSESFEFTWQFLIVLYVLRIIVSFNKDEYASLLVGTLMSVSGFIYIIFKIYKNTWTKFEAEKIYTSANRERSYRLKKVFRRKFVFTAIATIVYLVIVYYVNYTDSVVVDLISITSIYLSCEVSNLSKKLYNCYKQNP